MDERHVLSNLQYRYDQMQDEYPVRSRLLDRSAASPSLLCR